MVAVCIRLCFFSFNGVVEHEQMSGNGHSGPLRLLTSPFVPVRFFFPPTVNVDGLTNRIASRYTIRNHGRILTRIAWVCPEPNSHAVKPVITCIDFVKYM